MTFDALQPITEANRRLEQRVHPTDWANPTPRARYDMVVLGGGTAGLVTAAGAAGLGAKVALVERALLGGDCLNTGCVPSKALLAAAKAANAARSSAHLGAHASDVRVDFAAVMERMRGLRADIAKHDSAERFQGLGVDVFLGTGRFTGRDTLDVDGTELRFKRACIATGSSAAKPPIPGLAESAVRTHEQLFSLTELPPRLVVVGGGPIGCEMAQAFARFGSAVTLVERAERILGGDIPDAAAAVQRALESDGVQVLVEHEVKSFARGDGVTAILVEGPGGALTVEAEEVLLAIGRAPRVDGLGLDDADVAHDRRRGILVDDRLRTTNKRIYAAGDCASRFQFTHTADALARIVLRNALFRGRTKASDLVVPWCTYTDPEVAHTGLTAEAARLAGRRGVETVRIDLDSVDRAILEGRTDGFLELVHDHKGRVLGSTLVAPHAGESIGEATLAIQRGVKVGDLGSVIHPYPTVGEVFRKAGDAANRSKLTPLASKVLSLLLRTNR